MSRPTITAQLIAAAIVAAHQVAIANLAVRYRTERGQG